MTYLLLFFSYLAIRWILYLSEMSTKRKQASLDHRTTYTTIHLAIRYLWYTGGTSGNSSNSSGKDSSKSGGKGSDWGCPLAWYTLKVPWVSFMQPVYAVQCIDWLDMGLFLFYVKTSALLTFTGDQLVMYDKHDHPVGFLGAIRGKKYRSSLCRVDYWHPGLTLNEQFIKLSRDNGIDDEISNDSIECRITTVDFNTRITICVFMTSIPATSIPATSISSGATKHVTLQQLESIKYNLCPFDRCIADYLINNIE